MIDARPALDPVRTGVGRYTTAILRHVPPADPQGRYVAWYLDARGALSGRRRFRGWASNLEDRATRIPARVFGPLTTRTGLPRLEWLVGGFDLVLATNFLPPPTGAGAVLVVHDLAFEVLPETAPHHDDRWRRAFARHLDRAAGVIVPSNATAEDLVRIHGVEPSRIDVVPHGTDADAFRPAPEVEVQRVRRRLGLGERYVLFLGGLEPRKNLEALVHAFAMLEDGDVWLAIAGGRVPWAPGYERRVERAIAALPEGVRRRIVRTGYLSEQDRRALLSGAQALAYPSRYEGFGLPILEAFAANVPVLTSEVSALPEVAGEAAVLVDPEDPGAIAAGLAELLADEDLRNVLRAAGTARVASFTWERCARATVAALYRAVHRAGGG
ncbi:MAG: glycosyl transferase family 1 [Actinomycetota bacterium]|nr:MAG: glycosyl transferase family 1 [Actinomycetota bacterium]